MINVRFLDKSQVTITQLILLFLRFVVNHLQLLFSIYLFSIYLVRFISFDLSCSFDPGLTAIVMAFRAYPLRRDIMGLHCA